AGLGMGMAGPVLLWAAALAAIGVIAYEVWNHWAAVKRFFKQWGEAVLGFLLHPFTALPRAIRAAWVDIKSASAWVAHGISRFFVGHSPIPEGPLHDLNLGRDIARTMSRGSALAGAAVLATAFAGPMAVPDGSFAPSGGGMTI